MFNFVGGKDFIQVFIYFIVFDRMLHADDKPVKSYQDIQHWWAGPQTCSSERMINPVIHNSMKWKRVFTFLDDFSHGLQSFDIPSKEYKVVRQFFRRRVVSELAVPLAHSWDTGPKHKHRALSRATTLYAFPIQTIQCRRSEMWLFQIAFSTGSRKWSTPFGMWKCDRPGFDTAISQFFSLFPQNLASTNRRRKFSWLLFQLILMIS